MDTSEETGIKRVHTNFLKAGFYSFIIFTCLCVIVDIIIRWNMPLWSENEDYSSSEYSWEDCNVSWILIRGTLDTYASSLQEDDGSISEDVTSSDDVLFAIETAKEDENIKALLIEIDSYGGSPVAAEEIATALKDFGKPSYAHIRGAWASAAYWVATGADTIFASQNSDIGSIGATMSYLDYSQKNKNEGISYQEITSGKYKDSGSPEKPLNEEEKALFQRDINIIAQNFIEAVAKNRNLSIEEVQKIADGSTMLGKAALEKWLIDRLAVMNEVHHSIENDIWEDIEICWN